MSILGVRNGVTDLGVGREALVLVGWCLIRFHVNVRLLGRSWPVKIYLLSGKKLLAYGHLQQALRKKELEKWQIRKRHT